MIGCRGTWLALLVYWTVAIFIFGMDPEWGGYFILLAVVATLILFLTTDILYVIFLLSLMTTSFFSIVMAGSHVRIPFVLNLFVLLAVGKHHLKDIIKSRIFLSILLYIIWTLLLTTYTTSNLLDSFRVGCLPILLLLISVNVATIILSKKIDVAYAFKIIIFAGVLNIALGILQYFGYAAFGIEFLNLTEVQQTFLSMTNRMSATFWEPDTFGKFLMVFSLLLLPFVAHDLRSKVAGRYHYIFVLAILSLLINRTRSAWAGLLVGVAFFVSLQNISMRMKGLVIILVMFIAVAGYSVVTMFEPRSDELNKIIYRIKSLRSIEDMRKDSSAMYRIRSIEHFWRIVRKDTRGLICGYGFEDREKQRYSGAVSNIFLGVMQTSGIVGITLVAFSLIFAVIICLKYRSPVVEDTLMARGCGLSVVGMVVSSQLAPMWFDPIFWMILGLAIYLEIDRQMTVLSPS